jgi:hypothetical protein
MPEMSKLCPKTFIVEEKLLLDKNRDGPAWKISTGLLIIVVFE